MKTLEYRIYRKLREKLKNYLNNYNLNVKNTDFTYYLDKFWIETKNLCALNKPAKPIEFYLKVATNAFKTAKKFPNRQQLMLDYYISFLNLVINSV
jgi:hypothetical protein